MSLLKKLAEQGKLEGLTSSELNFILLDEIAERLLRIENIMQQQIPKGFAEGVSFTVYDNGVELKDELKDLNWFSFYIINESDNPVYVQVNNTSRIKPEPQKCTKTSPVSIDMKSPKIKSVFLFTDGGKEAIVRIGAVK